MIPEYCRTRSGKVAIPFLTATITNVPRPRRPGLRLKRGDDKSLENMNVPGMHYLLKTGTDKPGRVCVRVFEAKCATEKGKINRNRIPPLQRLHRLPPLKHLPGRSLLPFSS